MISPVCSVRNNNETSLCRYYPYIARVTDDFATGRITFFINTDVDSLRTFMRPDFINTQNNKIDFMRNGDELILARPVVLNKWTGSNKYSAGHAGLMTRTDNHNMIVRAFATAWRYRMAYEKHGDLEHVVKSEQTS